MAIKKQLNMGILSENRHLRALFVVVFLSNGKLEIIHSKLRANGHNGLSVVGQGVSCTCMRGAAGEKLNQGTHWEMCLYSYIPKLLRWA